MSKTPNKAPAFQFYFDRFNSSTALWDDCQVGKYIRLMICQANKGYVSEKELRKVGEGDTDVLSKFKEIAPGQYANEVLTGILSDRDAYRESRQKNRLSGLKKKECKTHDKHMSNICQTYDVHMVDVVVDVDKGKEVKKEKGGTGEKQKPTDLIPESWNRIAFDDLWRDYKLMRVKIRKNLSERAEMENLKDLIRLSGGDWFKAEQIVLNSIKNSWAGFFEPKPIKQPKNEGRYANENARHTDVL